RHAPDRLGVREHDGPRRASRKAQDLLGAPAPHRPKDAFGGGRVSLPGLWPSGKDRDDEAGSRGRRQLGSRGDRGPGREAVPGGWLRPSPDAIGLLRYFLRGAGWRRSPAPPEARYSVHHSPKDLRVPRRMPNRLHGEPPGRSAILRTVQRPRRKTPG